MLIIILFGALFYWFSLRPSWIKQNCYETATNRAVEKYQEASNTSEKLLKYNDYNQIYKMCIERHGL